VKKWMGTKGDKEGRQEEVLNHFLFRRPFLRKRFADCGKGAKGKKGVSQTTFQKIDKGREA